MDDTLTARRSGAVLDRTGYELEVEDRFDQPFLDERIDLLLVMTINAGFGGQAFVAEHLSKVERADEIRRFRDLPFRIQVDGGIGPETAGRAVAAGADVLVAGSAIFGAPDPPAAARAIRAAAVA